MYEGWDAEKEILDENGNIRQGCKIIKKGEVYERKIFTVKDSPFKQESFLDEAKVFYTDLINQMVLDDKDRLSIFDKNGLYLATRKVGKNNPKAEEIKADNEILMEWNRTIDRAIVSGVPDADVVELKKTEITDKIKDPAAKHNASLMHGYQSCSAAEQKVSFGHLGIVTLAAFAKP